MAAVVPPSDQAVDLLKNVSLDSQTKTLEITEPTKKSSVNSGNGQVQPSNRSVTPLIPDYTDPTVGYYPNAYYYGGYDGSTIDWEEYSKYMNADGVDLSHGLYGYGYPSYAPYSPAGSPVLTVGQDGQFYGAHHYQYPNSYYQPLTTSGGSYPASTNSKGETTTPATADELTLTVDTTKGTSNGAKGNTGTAHVKSTPYQNSGYCSYVRGAQNSYQDPRYGFDGVHSPVPWLDSSMYSEPKTRNNGNNTPASYGNSVASRNFTSPRPMSGLNTANGYINGMYPNKLYGQYGSTYRSGYGYGSNTGWLTVDNKYKPRGRGNGFFCYNNENSDGLNELNRGPRARPIKNQKLFTPIALAVKGQNVTLPTTETIENEVKDVKEVKEVSLTPDREQYNKSDFPETYVDAKFFIIKSYSEDDVHKSVKYNVWASTQNGNKKLDTAYQEAQQKSEPCPVFLLFSVNTSGQFVGVAEMIGPVDFDKSLEYWQQDKWIGCFPVKWHIVKDVPNSLLKHIILEYNENKPVTNSRDTQEVKLEQGLQVVKIFKEHSSKQSILDDFEFYEDRQKKIQEKKAKQLQFQKQAWEGKPAVDEKLKEGIKVEVPKTADVVTDVVNEVKVVQVVGKDVVAIGVVNGVANGC